MNPIAQTLKVFARVLDAIGQDRRAESYRVAVATIEGRTATINPLPHDADTRDATIKALTAIPGIGTGIAAKIYEIITHGSIAEMHAMMIDPEIAAKILFCECVGVGPATAEKWVRAGYRTIEDLRIASAGSSMKTSNQAPILRLTTMQKCGLQHFEDLRKPIPREEVAVIGAIIRGYVLSHVPDAIFDIAGSYRRELPSSGDIDCIVTSPSGSDADVLSKIMSKLDASSPVACVLMKGDERASFVMIWNGTARQVDILVVPYASYFAALTYFTGSYSFNEAMRAVAKSRGMLLNQHGLWRVSTLGSRSSVTPSKTLIPTTSEQDVFARVGIEWVLPRDRKSGQNVVKIGR